METSKQIAAHKGQGGPYRSLDRTLDLRRASLRKEVRLLNKIKEWRFHRKETPFGILFLLLAIHSLFLVTYPNAFPFPALIFVFVSIISVLVSMRSSFFLHVFDRHGLDVDRALKQKLDELAELPPE